VAGRREPGAAANGSLGGGGSMAAQAEAGVTRRASGDVTTFGHVGARRR
jgi:hypothetical protein